MDYTITTKTVPTFYFIGVTTGKSSINKVFPLWMDVFGKPEVVLEGIDHSIHDEPENYRNSVAQLKYDPLSLGALVTTHKMDVYSAASDMFDYFDSYARTTAELSCISKRNGELHGHAKDPITAGLSLEAIIEPGYFVCVQQEPVGNQTGIVKVEIQGLEFICKFTDSIKGQQRLAAVPRNTESVDVFVLLDPGQKTFSGFPAHGLAVSLS